MSACGPFESYDLKNEDEQFTNVEYSEDGKSVTIYMDGCAPVPANRALSKSLAILGHDFFEVVFLYNPDDNPAHYVIARGSWELGQPAGVNGIYRTQAGVPYDAAISGAPALGHGTAIMFAGKKNRQNASCGRSVYRRPRQRQYQHRKKYFFRYQIGFVCA